jgi:hypothetical protein
MTALDWEATIFVMDGTPPQRRTVELHEGFVSGQKSVVALET